MPSDDGDVQKYYKTRDAIPVITNGRKLVITTIGDDGATDKSGKQSVSEKNEVRADKSSTAEKKNVNQNSRSGATANMTVLNSPSPLQSFTDAVVLSTMDQLCAAQLAKEGDFVQAEAMFLNALQHMEKFQKTEEFQKLAENYVRFLYDRGRLADADNYCIRSAAMYFWKKDENNGQLSFAPEATIAPVLGNAASCVVPRNVTQESP